MKTFLSLARRKFALSVIAAGVSRSAVLSRLPSSVLVAAYPVSVCVATTKGESSTTSSLVADDAGAAAEKTTTGRSAAKAAQRRSAVVEFMVYFWSAGVSVLVVISLF